MDNELTILGAFGNGVSENAPADVIDWLQPGLVDATLERPPAATTAIHHSGGQPSVLQHIPPQPLADQLNHHRSLQQQHALHALQAHAMVSPAETFGWSEFSPRSINVAGPGPPPSTCDTSATLKRLQRQNSQIQAALDLAVTPTHPGYSGMDLGNATLLGKAATVPQQQVGRPPRVQAFGAIPGRPVPATHPLPPLPVKGKRGRGASKKGQRAPGGATVARGVSKKADISGTGKAAPPPVTMTAEEKRRIRAERNRESAEKSRLRRKKYTDDLEKEVDMLRETNKTLKTRSLDLMTMLQRVDSDVSRVVASGEGLAVDGPNGAAALKAAIHALENVKTQCPMTFGTQSTRVPELRVASRSANALPGPEHDGQDQKRNE